jgi:hypothetical protein
MAKPPRMIEPINAKVEDIARVLLQPTPEFLEQIRNKKDAPKKKRQPKKGNLPSK